MKHKIKTSLLLSAIAIAILHVINKCVAAAATIKNLLNKGNGKYYHWRFGDIYYTKSGTGNPLLLIHHLSPFSSSYEWYEMIRKLSKNHTVYAIDLLGCGRSDKPNMTYTNFLYVQLITDFIKNIIGQKTDVVAAGISSSFVVMACKNDSDLFHKILMINPEKLTKLCSIPGKKSKTVKFLMELPIIGTALYHMLSSKNTIEYQFTEQYIYNPFRLSDKYVNVYYESAHLGGSNGKYLMASLNGGYVNANICKALEEIDNSMLIIGGKNYNDMENTISEYTNCNPAIECDYLNDCKFLPQIETPDTLYNLITVYL